MKDKFVVGVIGTQNTGKSTFIKDLMARFKDTDNAFKTVGCDYRRKIEEAGLHINRNGNIECQKIICDTLIEQLDIISRLPNDNYITDRSPIDALAYTIYLLRHSPESNVTQKDIDEMYAKVKDSIRTYDLVLYIDLDNCDNVQVEDDRFRDTNLEYRREIDSIFKEIIKELGEDISGKLNSNIRGTREDRVNQFIYLEGGRFIN